MGRLHLFWSAFPVLLVLFLIRFLVPGTFSLDPEQKFAIYRKGERVLVNKIKDFVRVKKYMGYSKSEMYFEAVKNFGNENEALIRYIIDEEFSGYPANRTPYRNHTKTAFPALSLAFGILSFFIAGIIFGPLAIYFGNKAIENGESGMAGKVCGIIGLIGSLIVMLALCSHR